MHSSTFWLIVYAVSLSAFCPEPPAAQNKDAAATAISKHDYATAIALYEKATVAHPTDGIAWERLGGAYQLAGQYDKAINSFQKAIDNGFTASVGKYNLACAYGRAGNKTRAIGLLSEAVTSGFTGPISTNPDLANLRDDPKFQEIVKSARSLKYPCKDTRAHPEYRQLDFWLGSWEVFSGEQKVGDSEIQLILGDCVVFENWKEVGGGEGKSLNKYNNETHKWEQFWVEDDGGTQYFTGELVQGELRYVLDQVGQTGTRTLRHLTFSRLPGGRVKQYSQKSVDDGKTWATEYDLTYVPRKQGSGLR